MTLEEIVNSLKSAGQDYGQLFNNNPKYTAVASNVTKGLENLVPPQFTNTQDAKSQEYSKKLAEWALGNGMGMSGMALAVSGYGGAKNIGDILNKKYGENIEADISGNNKGLTLNKIIVDKEKRNQGLGSSFLKDLTKYADLNKQPISLTAGGDFGGNKARQINLYKKFGFLENKGKNKDYSISENMYRNPVESNLNANLLKKYLSTGKLSPKEMAQYEANGLAMETPQLQRYNVANAIANPERQAYMSTSDVPVYHGRTHKDIRYGEKSDLTSLQSGIGKAEGERLFSSDNPYLASSYAGTIHEQPAIYPLVAKSNDIYSAGFPMPSDNEISAMSENEISKLLDNIKSYNLNLDKNRIVNNGIMDADIANKNTVKFNQIIDNPSYRPLQEFPTDVYASKSGLRSRFAAFDPLRKNSSSLLASGLLGALLFNNENKTSENK